MTDRTHWRGEDIAGLSQQVIDIADKAFALGREVAVVRIVIGAETDDPWGLAFAVAEAVSAPGLAYVCRDRHDVPGHAG